MMNITKRQQEIIGLLCEGLMIKEIAVKIEMSASSCEKEVQKLRDIFHAKNTPNLIYKFMVEFYG